VNNDKKEDRIFIKLPGLQPMGPTRTHSVEYARIHIDNADLGNYGEGFILVNGKVVAHKIGKVWQ
jgi:hypothetical protein